jgi:hypothetical protein
MKSHAQAVAILRGAKGKPRRKGGTVRSDVKLIAPVAAFGDGIFFEARMPVHVVSEGNMFEHYQVKRRRRDRQRAAVNEQLKGWNKPPLPLVITLTRIAPRKLDSDNLAMAFKRGVRDTIAKWLGVDDGDERIEWRYAQRKAWKYERGDYGIAVEFAPKGRDLT